VGGCAWFRGPDDELLLGVRGGGEGHPVAGNYVRRLVVDIDADVTSLKTGAAGAAMPDGSRGEAVCRPFPPSGTHDYEFTLYALCTDRLESPEKVSLEAFESAIEPHLFATATLVGKFTKIRAN
jgi:phosphatidylethanolamine-binding protein (PEBP) family uncharacterized protein